jgi:type I site-specific restriction endonuclease
MIDNLFERFDELNESVDRLEVGLTRRMDKLETRIDGLEAKMEANHEKVMNTLDFIVGKLQRQEEEEAAGTVWLRRHDRQITGLDHRVQKLEEVSA